MLRHARLTVSDDELDELHRLKRRLARERAEKISLEDLLREAVGLLLRQYGAAALGGKTNPGSAQ